MEVSLIGMSGVGKSKLSKQLVGSGWDLYDCDGAIARRLQRMPDFPQGYVKATAALAEWMGKPYEDRYAERSQIYLGQEAEITRKFLGEMAISKISKNVIDTTGSVIYLPKDALAHLAAVTTVIYIAAESDEQKAHFKQKLFTKPKPIIWGDAYQPFPGENPDKAMLRCYDDLFDERVKRYQALADFIIDREDAKECFKDLGKNLPYYSIPN